MTERRTGLSICKTSRGATVSCGSSARRRPMIEAVLLGRLKRPGAALAAVVADRIHPDFVPEDWTLPAVFYKRLPSPTTWNIDGSMDHKRPKFAFSCVAAQ